jgi:hypothetical protein
MDFWHVGRRAVILLGAWLFVSAFLIRDTPEQRVNAAVVGALAVLGDLIALWRWPRFHMVSVALSIWLFLSLWIVPGQHAGIVINDMLVATLMFGFAVIPPGERRVEEQAAWPP